MPLNLIKKYPQLLEFGHLTESQKTQSLYNIFRRDIEDNPALHFRTKTIRPIKGEEPSMALLFKHLTTEEVMQDENGKTYPKRIFEMERSRRIHWIKFHLEEQKNKGCKSLAFKSATKKRGRTSLEPTSLIVNSIT